MTAQMNSDSLRLGDAGQRVKLVALVVGIGGVVFSAGLYAFTPHDRFFRSYLVAFMLLLGICLAALLFTMIFHAVRAGWCASVRRIIEVIAGNLMWLWVLFIPIAVAMFAESLALCR